jgi:hypothetical protein
MSNSKSKGQWLSEDFYNLPARRSIERSLNLVRFAAVGINISNKYVVNKIMLLVLSGRLSGIYLIKIYL